MTRTAALDWAQLFLIQEAGQSEFIGKYVGVKVLMQNYIIYYYYQAVVVTVEVFISFQLIFHMSFHCLSCMCISRTYSLKL